MLAPELATLDQIVRELDSGTPATRLTGDRPGLGPLAAVVATLTGSRWPAPRDSLLALRRVAEAAQAPWPSGGIVLDALAALLSSGAELPRLLARRPERLLLLQDPDLGRAWDRGELEQGLQARVDTVDPDDPDGFAERLTSFRNDQYVRLAACEFLSLSSLEQVGRQLALLADVCLERAVGFVQRRLAQVEGPPRCVDGPCRLAALAMGKYGARELNFCSDIDLVFIYTSDEGAAGELSLHEFFSRVCQQVTRVLTEPNAEGYTFRVDLRLRPEGSRGPICNSLAGTERYYETWGGPYDRLAWLKARPAAGDLRLGQEMLDLLQPFVFPRSLHAEVVDQIQELYRRIDSEGRQGGTAPRGWNVKLGSGGIRQVEFLVQALQLLHGGRHPALRERATLPALDRLLFQGLITEREHRQLGEAYELWRRIEHRLQLQDGRQTHLLPGPGPARERVARHMAREPAAFDEEVGRRRDQVRAIFDTLGSAGEITAGGPAPLAVPGDALRPALESLLRGAPARAERVALLGRVGFAEPERAADQLELLAAKPWGPLGRAPHPAAARVALPLLEELVRSPDPDAALLHTVALMLRCGPFRGLWELLDHNRATLRLLMSLFGSSDHLARLFIDHPELMDCLLGAGLARPERELADLAAELEVRLGALASDDSEGRLNLLRRFRNEEVLRIGLHDIAGGLEVEGVWRQLSDLAQVLLGQVYPLVWREATLRYGTPRQTGGEEARMAVLALGKLGGHELTYASDLDLIFVFSGAGATAGSRGVTGIDNAEFFARLAQRLIGALTMTLEEGRLYEVDTRLRPSGNQGTLVVSWDALRAYHEGQAELWERQALIKARAVAGDRSLGLEVQRWIEAYVYSSPLDGEVARGELDRHRRRMEKELAAENGDFYNLKLGPGGLLDIDFIVQYLQLCHGGPRRSLRVRSSLEGLARLEEEGLIDHETATRLTQGYRFLRRIENRVRIVRDRAADRLPRRAEGLEVMARRLGYRQQQEQTPGHQLLEDYLETTGSNRAIYERIFGR